MIMELPIELKIVFTSMIICLILHFAAYPTTLYARFGEKLFGSYNRFLTTQTVITLSSLVIAFIYWIWTL